MARNYRYVIEALSAKHARLQGCVARDSPDKATYMADLQHVECVIRMYAPDWRPPEPINPRGPAILGSYGAVMRRTLDALRTADQPLSSREIAVMIAEPTHIQAVAGSINLGLVRRVGKGVVRHGGKPLRWSLMRPVASNRPTGD